MKQKKILILLLLLVIPMVFYHPVISSAQTPESGSKVVGKYDDGESADEKRWEQVSIAVADIEDILRLGTNFLFAFAILNGALCSIITIVKFAGSGTHPMHRRAAILDLLMCAVTTAMLGSTKLIATLILQLVITA